MRRGFSTSEAKVCLATIVGLIGAAFAGGIDNRQAGWGTVATATAYALGRALTKLGGAEAFGTLADQDKG